MKHEGVLVFNLDDIRKEFPVVERHTYLNHAAVAPIPRRTRAAVEQFVRDHNENAAIHYRQWEAQYDTVRRRAAQLINARPEEIAFVKNTSEGLCFAANGLPWKEGDNVVTANIEFPSNVYAWQNLTSRGVETRLVEAREGRILVDDVRAAMDGRTRAVAISHIEFGNGFRNDIAALGQLCRERGVFFIVDAIQALGHVRFDLSETPVDVLTADSHKWLLGAEGIGIFYCAPQIIDRLEVYEVGWNCVANVGDYEHYDLTLAPDARRFECGTLNTMGIFALGASLELLLETGLEIIESRLKLLSDTLVEALQRKGYRILSPRGPGEWSGIVSFKSDRYPTEELHRTLRARDIIGARRGGGIRISPHFYNTEEEVLRVAEALPGH